MSLYGREELEARLVGKVLIQDLIDEYGAIVIPKNTLVTQQIIVKAMQHPIVLMPEARVPDYSKQLQVAIGQLDLVFEHAREHNRIRLGEVKRVVVPAINLLSQHPQIAELLHLLQLTDDYTVSHSLAVSVLATMIGRWMQLSNESLQSLMVAGTLHDIGKMKVPVSILNKPSRLTAQEYEEMKRHTLYGYELIKSTPEMTEEQALAALQHHERADGSGYPHGLTLDDTSMFARMIGVVDVFHAMTSKRVYHEPKPMYEILKEMNDGMFGQYDPHVIRIFLSRMMESLIGSRVSLSDGNQGRIILIPKDAPTSPLIQTVDNRFIDLASNGSIRIVRFLSEGA